MKCNSHNKVDNKHTKKLANKDQMAHKKNAHWLQNPNK